MNGRFMSIVSDCVKVMGIIAVRLIRNIAAVGQVRILYMLGVTFRMYCKSGLQMSQYDP